MKPPAEHESYLQGEEPVLQLHLLGEEICANRSLVLIAELLVHISKLNRSSRKHILQTTTTEKKESTKRKFSKFRHELIRIAGYWFIKDVFPTLDRRKQIQKRSASDNPAEERKRGGDPTRSPAVAEDDDLEEGAAVRGHRDLGPSRSGDLATGEGSGLAREERRGRRRDFGAVANRDASRSVVGTANQDDARKGEHGKGMVRWRPPPCATRLDDTCKFPTPFPV
jgi:hypothetical protein